MIKDNLLSCSRSACESGAIARCWLFVTDSIFVVKLQDSNSGYEGRSPVTVKQLNR
ncbi:MAG: hypothetical protein WBB82_13160 [Limnothrix sp.]